MTRKEFDRRIKDCREDIQSDGKDVEDVALDVADCLLRDEEIKSYVAYRYGGVNVTVAREIVADLIVG